MSGGKPVTTLRGVGERQAERLRALGVETIQDLLFLLPLRYEDRTQVVPLGELRAGGGDELGVVPLAVLGFDE